VPLIPVDSLLCKESKIRGGGRRRRRRKKKRVAI